MNDIQIIKRRDRAEYSFANINLLGKCNAKCFFCLGEDIPELLHKHNQTKVHFSEWKNFEYFLEQCRSHNIKKLYITGQNTDSLMYKYINELVHFLKVDGFTVGLRTNGYLAEKNLSVINKCENSVGYSIHSLDPDINFKIMGRKDFPNWNEIIPATKNPRIAIVVNRYNVYEFFSILQYLSKFKNIKYIQARRISTDTRHDQFKEDIACYEKLFDHVEKYYPHRFIGEFYHAQQYNLFGMQVNFWRTVQTSVNSMNYFTDGTVSDNYFVVEGYLNNYKRA